MSNGVLDPSHVPHISDMFIYPPGNWISRWTLVQAFHMGLWAQVLLFVAEAVPVMAEAIDADAKVYDDAPVAAVCEAAPADAKRFASPAHSLVFASTALARSTAFSSSDSAALPSLSALL